MASHINKLEMENIEDNKKSDKHFGQNKADVDMSASLPKVYMYTNR